MGAHQLRPILLTFTVVTFAIVQQCWGSTRPSIWFWPEQGNPNVNKTRNISISKTRGTGTADARIRPKALYAFGVSSVYLQQRTMGTTPTTRIWNCTCVPYFYCEGRQVVSDGSGVIDIRLGRPCISVLEVCCRNPHVTSTSAPTTSTTVSTTTSPPGEIGNSTSTSTASPRKTEVPLQCGTLHPNGVHARILGFKDSETQFGEYPWQAAMLERKLIAGRWVFKFVCGAALIWASVVVTAAHCVQGRVASQLIIRLGEWDTQSTSEFLPHQDLWGQQIVVHPLYYSGAYLNDIALVFLQTPAVAALHIGTVCLPFPSPQPSYDSSSCWATGWGKNAFGLGGKYQAILHEVELPIISNSICSTLLRNTSLGTNFNFHGSYLCAGGLEGKDTCIGDGGGPLVCPSLADPWRYVLAGITSWGIGCGTSGVPGVYADVSQFSAWIQTQISLRVPLLNPRELRIEPNVTTTRNGSDNTRASQPQQYI